MLMSKSKYMVYIYPPCSILLYCNLWSCFKLPWQIPPAFMTDLSSCINKTFYQLWMTKWRLMMCSSLLLHFISNRARLMHLDDPSNWYCPLSLREKLVLKNTSNHHMASKQNNHVKLNHCSHRWVIHWRIHKRRLQAPVWLPFWNLRL